MPVLMELSRILISEMEPLQIIELREVDGERKFPILIGINEAEAIKRRFQGSTIKRPLTHELLASVIEHLGASLDSIVVNDLSDSTFFAKLILTDASGERVEVDSRPSDAIALGIANDVPIYVEEHVLEQAQSDQ